MPCAGAAVGWACRTVRRSSRREALPKVTSWKGAHAARVDKARGRRGIAVAFEAPHDARDPTRAYGTRVERARRLHTPCHEIQTGADRVSFNARRPARVLQDAMPAPRLVPLSAAPLLGPQRRRADDARPGGCTGGVRRAGRATRRAPRTDVRAVRERRGGGRRAGARDVVRRRVAGCAVAISARREVPRLAAHLSSAHNRCRNHLRHEGVKRVLALQPRATPPESLSPDQIDPLLIEERRRGVRDALSRLPARMREAPAPAFCRRPSIRRRWPPSSGPANPRFARGCTTDCAC